MNLSGIIAISFMTILIGSLVISYFFTLVPSRAKHEPNYSRNRFAEGERQKGISAAVNIFWILLLFLMVVVLIGM